MEPTTKQILICVVISFFLAVSSNRKFFLNINGFPSCLLKTFRIFPRLRLDDATKIVLRNVSYLVLGSPFNSNFSMFSGFNVFNVPSS